MYIFVFNNYKVGYLIYQSMAHEHTWLIYKFVNIVITVVAALCDHVYYRYQSFNVNKIASRVHIKLDRYKMKLLSSVGYKNTYFSRDFYVQHVSKLFQQLRPCKTTMKASILKRRLLVMGGACITALPVKWSWEVK